MLDKLKKEIWNEETFFSRFRAVFIIILIIGFINSIKQGYYTTGTIQFSSISITFSVIVIIIYVLYVLWKGEKERNEFIAFAYENRDKFREGKTVLWKYKNINKETKMVVFYSVLSFILFTDAYPSRFIFKDEGLIFRFGILYTLVCLICGWWSISLAPFYNIKYIIKNISGGHKYTIGSLLDEIDSDIITELKKRIKKRA